METMNIVVKDDSVSISFRSELRSGCAELSVMHVEDLQSLLDVNKLRLSEGTTGDWFFFNRLFVSKYIRNRGHGTSMLRILAAIADECQFNILNTLNPYGDLDMAQLERFFVKNGYTKLADGLVVRMWKQVLAH